MTIETNTFLTFSQVGIREDLTDAIYNISPTITPVVSALSKSNATNTLHQWETDTLDSPNNTGSLEGDAFSAAAITATSKVGNTCMILKRPLEVSGTAQAVKAAGRKNEYTYQVMKKGKALRRDIEYTLLQNTAPNSGSSTVARAMRPLLSWYATSVVNAGSGGANGSSSAARTDGTQSDLSETTFASAIQTAWTAGGYPTMAVCGPVNKRKITQFAGPSGTQRVNDADGNRLVANITVYESDFGDIKIVPDHFSRERDIHLIDPDYLALAVLRDIAVQDRAKTADADKAEILWEGTLEVRNEAAHALIADLTTS